MGFISELAKGSESVLPRSPTDRGQGRALWEQIFQSTTKEGDGGSQFPRVRQSVVAGGSYGRSVVSDPAFKRLLQAVRSNAPGGWSDDRYEQTRHFTGVNYVAIHRTCTQLQQAEFQVFRKDRAHPEGKRPINENDPPEGDRVVKPYALVHLLQNPNKHDSFGKMLYRIGQQKRLTGSALVWMVPNELGVPMELYNIPTALAIPQPTINPDYPDGFYRIQPVYPYGPFSSYPTPASAVGAPIPAQWMLRFLYPHPLLRYDGYSPLTGMRLETDEFEMIGRSRHYKMRRSINPSAALQMDEVEGAQPLQDEEVERLVSMFEAMHQGPENHGNLLISPPGGKLEEWGRTALEMDYPNSWEQLSSFVLGGGFGITKPAAGMVEGASYANLYAALKQLHLVTLKPDCDDLASDLTKHLAPFFGDDLIVDIRCPRIDDHDILFSKIKIAMDAKAITKNSVLELLDLPVTKEEWGKDIAGDPSEAEKEQQKQQGAGGPGGPQIPGQEQQGQEGAPSPQAPDIADGKPPEEKEIQRTQPKPGKLGEGSLGERMKGLPVNGRKRNSNGRLVGRV
jgi:phage portal protein BeeE